MKKLLAILVVTVFFAQTGYCESAGAASSLVGKIKKVLRIGQDGKEQPSAKTTKSVMSVGDLQADFVPYFNLIEKNQWLNHASVQEFTKHFINLVRNRRMDSAGLKTAALLVLANTKGLAVLNNGKREYYTDTPILLVEMLRLASLALPSVSPEDLAAIHTAIEDFALTELAPIEDSYKELRRIVSREWRLSRFLPLSGKPSLRELQQIVSGEWPADSAINLADLQANFIPYLIVIEKNQWLNHASVQEFSEYFVNLVRDRRFNSDGLRTAALLILTDMKGLFIYKNGQRAHYSSTMIGLVEMLRLASLAVPSVSPEDLAVIHAAIRDFASTELEPGDDSYKEIQRILSKEWRIP